MEYSSGAWEIHIKWDKYTDSAKMLVYLLIPNLHTFSTMCHCRVDHVVMEYSPGAWEIHIKWDKYTDSAKMLVCLITPNLHTFYTMCHCRVNHVVMEYSSGAWEIHFNGTNTLTQPKRWCVLSHQTYTIFHHVLLQSGSCGNGVFTRSLGNPLQVG